MSAWRGEQCRLVLVDFEKPSKDLVKRLQVKKLALIQHLSEMLLGGRGDLHTERQALKTSHTKHVQSMDHDVILEVDLEGTCNGIMGNSIWCIMHRAAHCNRCITQCNAS